MRTYIAAKVHDICVTDKSVRYRGSVSVGAGILRQVGIDPYEQVHVVNLRNGERWVTYALPHDDNHAFTLNGGGALLGEIGDRCVLMTYRQSETFIGCQVLFMDERNEIREGITYEPRP